MNLLERLTEAFNTGVRTGDFTAFVRLFTPDAVISWEGVPQRGPLEGIEAIERRYRDDPPDDEIALTRAHDDGARIFADFVWRDIPEARGGTLVIVPAGDRVASLRIAYGGPLTRWSAGTRPA